jgi:predicted dehydrogenase
MKFGFGIIGCGMIANFHARAIEELRGCRLVACFDAVPQAAHRLAETAGCRAYEELSQMVADTEVDIVTICTPSGAHLEPALAAARAGKHVIVEKPLEITLRRCDRIIQACEQHHVKLATIFPSRFHESAQLMKRAADAGRFGMLTLGSAYVKWYRTQDYYDSGAWRGTWKLDGGGALMNQAIHSVDLLLWLMGPVESVTAHAATLAHERIAVEDVIVANLRFASGALGTLEATTAAYPGSLKRIELCGSQGSATLEEEDIKAWQFARKAAQDARIRKRLAGKTESGGGASDPAAIGHQAHAALFKDFVHAITSGGQPLVDGIEGRRSVELILAVYKAAESGREVKLPLKSDPTLQARKRDDAVT